MLEVRPNDVFSMFSQYQKMIFIHLLHLSCKTYCDLIFRNLLYISGGGDSEDCPNIERLLHQKEVSSEHNLVLEFIYMLEMRWNW